VLANIHPTKIIWMLIQYFILAQINIITFFFFKTQFIFKTLIFTLFLG